MVAFGTMETAKAGHRDNLLADSEAGHLVAQLPHGARHFAPGDEGAGECGGGRCCW